MRFRELHMRPFGTFRDYSLEFSDAKGLHLVFGTNGAGKSTTLEALRSVLFGIDSRRRRVHAPSDLRVGAVLVRSNGESVSFMRRAAKKLPLWTLEDDEALPLEVLTPFLGNLTRDRFVSLFGLDHEGMIAGGKDLLNGEGEMGEALFGAMLGGQRLAAITSTLEEDRKRLYADHSRKSQIQVLLKEHVALSKEVRQAAILPANYARDKKELKALSEARASAAEERAAARARVETLKSTRRSLHWCDELQAKEAERAALGVERALDPAQTARAAKLFQELEVLAERGDERSREIHGLETRLAEASAQASPRALEAGPEIEACIEQRGAFRAAALALVKANAELAEARQRSSTDAEPERSRFGGASDASLESLGERADRLASDLALRQSRLEAAVEALCAKESTRASAEKRLRELNREGPEESAGALELKLAESLLALEPFRGGVETLRTLALPTEAEVAARIEEVQREAARQRELDGDLERASAESAEATRGLAQLTLAGEDPPPTQAELEAARQDRDELLRKILDQDTYPPLGAVDLERSIQRADRLVDHRLKESSRAAERESLEARLAQAGEAAERSAAAVEAHQESAKASLARWSARLAGTPLAGLTAVELKDWLGRRQAVLQEAAAIRQEAAARHEAAREEEATARAAHETARLALETARCEWKAWADQHSLDAEAGPEAAQRELRKHVGTQAAARDVARLEQTQEEHEATLRAHVEKVATLCSSLALSPDEAALERALEAAKEDERPESTALTEARLDALEAALKRAREHAATRDSLRQRIESERGAAAASSLRIEEIRARLAALQEEANCASASDFKKLTEVSERAAALDADIARLRNDLFAEHGQDVDLAALADSIAALDEASIDGEIKDLESELEALDEKQTELALKEGQVRGRLEGEGSPAAARLQARIAGIEAELVDLTAEYVRGRLAATLLESEIERNRRETHGPLLQRAQGLFQTLTLGAYERLHPSESRGRQIMVARRPDGRQVGIDEMSSGTCDQLYLALRIASVEHMLKTVEPMPFIADDLFVNFDDERTEAALKVLAELARSTQVIVFSHHQSVVTTAERLSAHGVPVEVHRLKDERSREAQSSAAPP